MAVAACTAFPPRAPFCLSPISQQHRFCYSKSNTTRWWTQLSNNKPRQPVLVLPFSQGGKTPKALLTMSLPVYGDCIVALSSTTIPANCLFLPYLLAA